MSKLWEAIKDLSKPGPQVGRHVHTGDLREMEMASEVRQREIRDQLDRIEAMLRSLHMKLYGKVEP